jgi:hypothetical protein
MKQQTKITALGLGCNMKSTPLLRSLLEGLADEDPLHFDSWAGSDWWGSATLSVMQMHLLWHNCRAAPRPCRHLQRSSLFFRTLMGRCVIVCVCGVDAWVDGVDGVDGMVSSAW